MNTIDSYMKTYRVAAALIALGAILIAVFVSGVVILLSSWDEFHAFVSTTVAFSSGGLFGIGLALVWLGVGIILSRRRANQAE